MNLIHISLFQLLLVAAVGFFGGCVSFWVVSWKRTGCRREEFPWNSVFLATSFNIAVIGYVYVHANANTNANANISTSANFQQAMRDGGEDCRIVEVAKGSHKGQVIVVVVKLETLKSGQKCLVCYSTNQLGALAMVGHRLDWDDLMRLGHSWREPIPLLE